MKFDPDAKHYYFSKEQEMSQDEADKLQKALISSVFKPVSSEKTSPIKTAVALIIIIGIFLSIIITAVTGHIGACVLIFGSIFFVAGLYMIIAKPEEIYTSEKNNLKQSQNGAFIALIGAAIMSIPILIKYSTEHKGSMASSNIIICACGGMFMLGGAFFLLSTIAGIIKSSRGFGEEVEGECIGYIRSFHSTHETHHRTIVNTPVYEYYYDGQYLQAIGNEVYHGAAPIAVGERKLLNVDPSDPYDIYVQDEDQKPSGIAIGIIFPSIFIVTGIFLMWFALTHSIQPSAVKVAGGKTVITDSYVQEKYGLAGDDWTISERKISEITQESDGSWTLTFSDGEVRTDPDGTFAGKYDVGDSFYEVMDSSGTSIVFFNTDKWIYNGSHD